ncbi:MAG: SatD family protein [Aeromicrobium sp.]|uniref:SatD family protein n=1 Tax=Aeromicrobium sp. TaxID=1871063 RepID=UPI0025C5434E|nr:SatD family protein [Aeromicrobium sp.]MCK5891118.1 hypothetical protein [Aeromicrobium sp.]MDF1704155.1 SatD family protein [Aeromicrobium sp.]
MPEAELKDPTVRVAVIVDLVGSRKYPDRAWVHAAFTTAMDEVNQRVRPDQRMAPTLGDEAQARYYSVGAALRATLLMRLVLPDGLDCRAGVGVGAVTHLGTGAAGLIQDGPGWWAARDAINEAKAREVGRDRTLRTWYARAPLAAEYPRSRHVNALLLVRDEIVTTMQARSRRLLLGLLDGSSQVELAEREGISPSAVSQNLRRSGAYAVAHSQESFDS